MGRYGAYRRAQQTRRNKSRRGFRVGNAKLFCLTFWRARTHFFYFFTFRPLWWFRVSDSTGRAPRSSVKPNYRVMHSGAVADDSPASHAVAARQSAKSARKQLRRAEASPSAQSEPVEPPPTVLDTQDPLQQKPQGTHSVSGAASAVAATPGPSHFKKETLLFVSIDLETVNSSHVDPAIASIGAAYACRDSAGVFRDLVTSADDMTYSTIKAPDDCEVNPFCTK